MSASKDASPKSFGDQFSSMVKKIELPKGKDPKLVLESWQTICQFDFDMTNGELAWLKGTFCNRLYHINSQNKSKDMLTKKEWSVWRIDNIKETDETIRNWKKVADQFTRPEARKLGKSKMYATIRAEAEAARLNTKGNLTKPPVREAKVTPVPIVSFVECWEVVNEKLEGMGKVENAPDRFDDPKDKLEILKVQEANIKTARGMLDELETAIATTRKELEAYIAETKKSPSAKAPKVVAKPAKKRSTAIAKADQWVDLSSVEAK